MKTDRQTQREGVEFTMLSFRGGRIEYGRKQRRKMKMIRRNYTEFPKINITLLLNVFLQLLNCIFQYKSYIP